MSIAFSGADWLALLAHFLSLSLLAIGGAITTAPAMHSYLVDDKAWLTDSQFTSSIALAQAAPGPNVLFIALLGWNVGLNARGRHPRRAASVVARIGGCRRGHGRHPAAQHHIDVCRCPLGSPQPRVARGAGFQAWDGASRHRVADRHRVDSGLQRRQSPGTLAALAADCGHDRPCVAHEVAHALATGRWRRPGSVGDSVVCAWPHQPAGSARALEEQVV